MFRTQIRTYREFMFVRKRDGSLEKVSFDKVLRRVEKLSDDLEINVTEIAQKVCSRIYDGVRTSELDELTAQQSHRCPGGPPCTSPTSSGRECGAGGRSSFCTPGDRRWEASRSSTPNHHRYRELCYRATSAEREPASHRESRHNSPGGVGHSPGGPPPPAV